MVVLRVDGGFWFLVLEVFGGCVCCGCGMLCR